MRYEVYVYDAFEQDFTHSGIVGALTPISCVHRGIAGNLGELTLVHPIDETGKWMGLERGRIIKASTYVRATAEIDGDTIITTVERWRVKETSSKAERDVYSAKEEGRKLGRLKKGDEVIVVKKPEGEDRYKVKSESLTGWVDKDAIEYITEVILPENDPAAIEDIYPRWERREQLFRIYDEEPGLDSITARARPIVGDLYGNMTVYKNTGAVALSDAAKKMLDRCVVKHPFNVHTNIGDMRTGVNWRHKNPIFALFDPEEGICARWNVQAVVDNYDITLLKQAGKNRGMAVEYGRNLLGISCNVVDDEVITCVLPTGQKEDGKPLYLTDSEDELEAGNYIFSANSGEYPGPHVYHLECTDCTVSDELSVAKARERMRQQAQELIDSGVTMPTVNIKVTFANLGSTEEYRAWRGLEKIDLYDKVRVRVPEIGVNALLDAVAVETDCMTGETLSVEIGALSDVQISVASYQITGISGGKIYAGSIGAPQIGEGSINTGHIRANTIDANHIRANSIETQHLTAGSVNADKIRAGAIEADKIKAGAVNAEKIEARSITAQQLQTGLITAQSGLIADGAILAAQIASLNADVIDAGTLKAERLLIRGKNGLFYKINADAAGLSQEELSKEQYENLINGTVIVAKSITAEQIKAGTITALEINVPALFANEATINAINAMDITGNEYLKLYVGAAPGTSRNFLVGTHIDTVLTGNNTTNQSIAIYRTAPAFATERPDVGGYLTLSFDWATSGATGEFTPQWDGGTVYGIGGLNAIKLDGKPHAQRVEHTFQINAAEHGAPLTGLRIRMDGVTGTVTFSNMKLEKGNRATDWIPAPEDPAEAVKAGSTVSITEEEVKISTPVFTVDVPSTSGSDVQVNEEGFSAPVILSPTVAKAREGGIFTVGTNGDFSTLSEAFGNINGRMIEEDIVLKIASDSDPGGTIRGVSGSGKVLITPINMVNASQSAAWAPANATVTPIDSANNTRGVIIQATTPGSYRMAIYKVGHAGVLGLRGKRLTFRCTMYSGSAGDAVTPRVEIYMGSVYLGTVVRSGSNVTQKETGTVSFTVPANTGTWNELQLKFYISTSNSVTNTAKGYFEDIRLEVGDGISSLNTGVPAVTTNISCEGCSAEIDMHGLIFTDRMDGYHSAAYVNRCTFKGSNGFMLWGGYGAVYNCYGACASTAILSAGGASVYLYGTVPTGARSGLIFDAEADNGTPPAGDSPIMVSTATLNATKSGTYSGSSWMSDAAIRQGYTAGGGRMRGGMWFDTSSIAGKTIKKITLRLRRVEGYGKGGNVTVKIYGTDSPALSGQPALSSAYVDGQMAQGQVKTFNVEKLLKSNGTPYAGYVVYADDTAVMSGRTYSQNYARFTGTGGGENTIPQLVVTYQ